jgi:small subunit ribosomal protein S13
VEPGAAAEALNKGVFLGGRALELGAGAGPQAPVRLSFGESPQGVSTAPKESSDAEPQPTARTADAGPEAPAEKGAKKEKGAKGKEPKEGKEPGKKAKAGAPGAAGKAAKYVPDNPNFRYIVRVSNTDLDGTRPTALALTGVRGVGLRLAEVACRLADVKASERIGNLPEPTVESIETALGSLPTKVPAWMINHRREPADGETVHYIGPDLETRRRDDVNVMKMIRSYRGVRHERGQKVRGQRTRSNGRTGMAAGVLKKAAKEAAAAAGKEEAAPASPKPAAAAAAATAPKTPAKKE